VVPHGRGLDSITFVRDTVAYPACLLPMESSEELPSINQQMSGLGRGELDRWGLQYVRVSKDARQECSRGVTSGSKVAGLRGGQACKVTSGFSIKVSWKSCSLEGNRLERQW
jgi:hypothetical protein